MTLLLSSGGWSSEEIVRVRTYQEVRMEEIPAEADAEDAG